jgi:tetratricopeptide (TPR) repeat protein
MRCRRRLDEFTSLADLGCLLEGQGDFAGARPCYERALAIREKTLGPEHPDMRHVSTTLPACTRPRTTLRGARPLYERALAITEKAIGPEHPDTANSLSNLALLLQNQGDFAGARPLYDRALAIREKALGPTHRDTKRTRSNLARLLLMTCRSTTEALALGEAALAAHDKVLGRDHVWTKDSARVTGDALDALGRTEEAKALRERYGVTGA